MKNLILAVTLMGSLNFMSCRENEKKVVETTKQTMEDIQNQLEVTQDVESNLENASETAADIPQFSTGELQEFAQSYSAYFQELVQATEKRDSLKLQELTAEGLNWSKKASKWTQEMTEEDAQKWIKWSSRLRSSISNEY